MVNTVFQSTSQFRSASQSQCTTQPNYDLNIICQQLYNMQSNANLNLTAICQQLYNMQEQTKTNLNTLGQQLQNTQEETKSNVVTTSQQLHTMHIAQLLRCCHHVGLGFFLCILQLLT